MELLALIAILALSVAFGVAGSRLVLWAMFFFMMRHVAHGDSAVATLAIEPTYELDASPSAFQRHAVLVSAFREAGWTSVAYR